MRINTNLTAMNTFTQYTANNNKIAGAVAKLSSGYAINTAADNAAGLAISEKMRAQIRGLTKASANAQDAISLVQTAEGSLGEATEILQRMRELAVQASSDTNENEIDRAALQDEFAQLQQELNDIASTTTFNKKNLLDGSLAASQRTVNNVTLANSGMAVSVGKAAAGSYNFGVVIRQESAAVVARAGTATAAMGSVASATFTDVDTVDPTIEGALYNGNYTLETDIKDGNLTVKAQGDNGQTFYATLSKSDIEANLINGWNDMDPSANVLTLSFASADGAGDGFDIELTLANKPSTSENGLLALKSAIDDVTVSVDGGVNAQDATYGVYASLTGGEAVKLNAGDSSVTFSNGVTVSFDKLTATDVQVAKETTTASTENFTLSTGTIATDATSSTFEIDLANAAVDYDGTARDYTFNIGGKEYTVEIGEVADEAAALDAIGAALVDAVNADKITATYDHEDGEGNPVADQTATFTATYAGGKLTFESTDTAGKAAVAFDSTTVAATGTYTPDTATEDVALSSGILGKIGGTDEFGNATTTSTFDVTESAGKGLTFQVGANRGDEMVINLDAVNSETLGINSAKVTTQEAASAAIATVDSAINKVSSQRAYLGAIQNRLEYKINNLETSTENLTSAESQIRDVDMAKEMTAFTNANILQQAATAMLAQANSLPQNVLSLIRG